MLKKLMPIVFLMLGISSCVDLDQDIFDNTDRRAYYQFDANEQAQIPSYTEGQKLIFKNQRKEAKTFLVYSIHNNIKDVYGEGWGVLSAYAHEYFYFDNVDFYINDLETNLQYQLIFSKFPNDLELAKTKNTEIQENTFSSSIHSFPKWNGTDKDNNVQIKLSINDYKSQRTNLIINGITYTNVIVINSNNKLNIDDRNINTIYYLEGYGIIGFDDLNGNNWRIK